MDRQDGKGPPDGKVDSLADRRLIFVRVSACFADGAVLLLIFLGFFLLAELAIRGSSGGPLFLTQAARLADLMIPYFFLFFFVCFGYFTFFHFFPGRRRGRCCVVCGWSMNMGNPLIWARLFCAVRPGFFLC